MITILHGGGSLGTPKSDYVICARPLRLYLQGNEEEGVPEDGVGVTLPHQHIVGETLGQELVAVVEVDAHPDQDRQQGEQLDLRQIENKVLRKYRQLLPKFR